ncbi:MAG TPA: tetratricopeptide repeat protein [Candidatus Acidoferrales bacterium]|nr:tetratricopeptide repeat protein [Candidatus Acidoferrales bacterium]
MFTPSKAKSAALCGSLGLICIVACSAEVRAQSRVTLQNAPAVTIAAPNRDWGVTFNSGGFHTEINEIKPDGRRYAELINDSTHFIISFTLEEVPAGETGHSCKEVNAARMSQTPADATGGKFPGLRRADERLWDEGEKSILDFTFLPIEQKNRWICFRRDRVYVDVHISKTPFTDADLPALNQLAQSVTVQSVPSQAGVVTLAPPSGSGRSSMQYFGEGSRYYLVSRFKDAIPLYEQALALEKEHRQMERNYWLVLIDNLGMAYGMTGDLENARKTFQYGIDSAPEFPMFYYNMACYFGEKRDGENALIYLQKAYDRKANSIPGEGIPDPRSDDSFQALLRDPAFRKRVNSMVGGT